MGNFLEPRLIGELTLPKNNYRFFIPSYQRGYRWGKDEVLALLNDILEFLLTNKDKSQRYCLQPIVVKELSDGSYEVLDGQQRLTTIYILLSYLKEFDDEINLFGLEYETRPNSGVFLRSLTNELNEENPDYYHISQAYNLITNWFELKKDQVQRIKRKISEIVLEQIDIIWYEIKDDSNPIDVFTRINIGKIPLTNSELVKAIFLSKNNLQIGLNVSDDKIAETILNNKQSVIAFEWDAMEKQLQDIKFWNFIYNDTENSYQTRIDYIIDLVTESSIQNAESLESFNKYYNKVKEIRSDNEAIERFKKQNTSFIEEEWAELKAYFDILLEWYHDKWYNHIIGFLISRKINLVELLKEYKDLNKAGFKGNLLYKIQTLCLKKDLSELNYETGNKKTIEDVLLLHNVINSLIQPDTSAQFPFEQIKKAKWSLEHINAQNTEDLKEKDIPDWITDHLNYFKKDSSIKNEKLNSLIEKLEVLRINKNGLSGSEYMEAFLNVYSNVHKYVDDEREESNFDDKDNELESLYKWVTDEHSIANLTLLDVGSNAYLSNSVFGVKREKIKELDKRLMYIPNETRKVFFKYYSDSTEHNAYWTIEDRKAYIKDIESKVNNLNSLLEL